MLPQKTGLRFKHFISHHENRSLEDYNDNFKGSVSDKKSHSAKTTRNSSNRASWASQSPMIEIAPLRRASSSATTWSRLSPPVDSTAHSSVTSLCNCECAGNLAPIDSLSLPAPHNMEPRGEVLYLPLASASSFKDAKKWRLIFPEDPARPRVSISRPDEEIHNRATNVRDSTLDLLEALAMDPLDDDRTPTQCVRMMDDSDLKNVSEDMEKLNRHTDEAFEAVGNALADAKAATAVWHHGPPLQAIVRNRSVPRGDLKKDSRSPALLPKSPITRTKSLAKGKRKTLYRKKSNLLSRVRDVPLPMATISTRWTLTDVTSNMVDMFNGKIFRTEVDEMLTPDRLQRVREEEGIENERRLSIESTRSVGTDESAPTEPFHLEGLSSRITAAQRNHGKLLSFASSVLSPRTSPSRDNTLTRRKIRTGKARAINQYESGMKLDDLNSPSPPRMPTRSNVRGTPPALPTILEVSPLDLVPRQSIFSEKRSRQRSSESIQPPPNFILLPSTSWTLTSPLFQHGPIRIERKEKELLPDEELDWTAFQMAISGTMDEIGVDKRDDIEWADYATEVDEVLEWWAGYRFPHYGQMVQELSPTRTLTRKSELVVLKMRNGRPRGDSGTEKIVVEPPMQSSAVGSMKKSYTESLPPSPMLDFAPPSPGNGEEVIPMGYNLGHDLGDFLDWETHYVRKYFVDDD